LSRCPASAFRHQAGLFSFSRRITPIIFQCSCQGPWGHMVRKETQITDCTRQHRAADGFARIATDGDGHDG